MFPGHIGVALAAKHAAPLLCIWGSLLALTYFALTRDSRASLFGIGAAVGFTWSWRVDPHRMAHVGVS
jgi:hypothetical protein